MREIKFRGKCLNIGNWVYGVPLESKFNCVYILTKKGGLNADFINSRYTILDSRDSIPTDIDTIGQFTGLKDKNGVEIYEGDIVIRSGNDNCIIEWRNDRCKYDFKYKVDLMSPQWMGGLDYDYAKRELEVIGNIHEK